MLYTTKEIADMYGHNVTPYMITQTWIPNGLKYIRGKGNSYLFKQEWVEQYLEYNSSEKIKSKTNNITNIKQGTRRIAKTYLVH